MNSFLFCKKDQNKLIMLHMWSDTCISTRNFIYMSKAYPFLDFLFLFRPFLHLLLLGFLHFFPFFLSQFWKWNIANMIHRANLIHAEVISEKRITRIILTNDVSWGCEIENVGIQIDVTYHYTLNKSYLRSSDRGLRRCNNNHRNKRCDN